MEKTSRITEADFFSGIFAAVALRGHKGLFFNETFEEDVARIFYELKKCANQGGLDMDFVMPLCPVRGYSKVVRQGVFMSAQRGIISLEGSSDEIIKIKIDQDRAAAILADITGAKMFTSFVDRIVQVFSHSLLRE